MAKKYYVSGPISNCLNDNKVAFDETSRKLRELGHHALNPFDLDLVENVGKDWNNNLKRDIKYLMDCDGLVLLPNWEISRGAKLEVFVATSVGIPSFYLIHGELVEVPMAVECAPIPLFDSSVVDRQIPLFV